MTTTQSAVLVGIGGELVTIRVETGVGDHFYIIGLNNVSAYRETMLRVRSALTSVGLSTVLTQCTRVTIAPAVGRGSAALDLAIAVAVASAYGDTIDPLAMSQTLILGELGFGGDVRHVRGLVPMLTAAAEHGLAYALVPKDQLRQASMSLHMATMRPWLQAFGVTTLADALGWLRSARELPAASTVTHYLESDDAVIGRDEPCLSEVVGQVAGKRALEIAAVGHHSLLFVGPPGAGKTMLARRLPGILPSIDAAERLEIATIMSASGLLENGRLSRPFRAPHHTASNLALVGGGPDVRPGEVTLAHRGVLFLDELPEFPRLALEGLERSLRNTYTRVRNPNGPEYELPATALVVAAANPCPCGRLGSDRYECQCAPGLVASYRARIKPISGLLTLRVELQTQPLGMIEPRGDTSAVIRARVESAIDVLTSMDNRDVLTEHAKDLAITASAGNEALRLRIAGVARTCAALGGTDVVGPEHVAEAAALCNPPCAPFV